jgi:predicted chitinase
VSAEAAFDALRAYKRELTGQGLSDADVVTVNTLFASWERHALSMPNPTALTDAAAFFASVRNSFGSLSTEQVEGFNRLLQAMAVAAWPIAWAAYGLATAAAYRKGLDYYPWFGRGDVQLTWERNYRRADAECGLNGALIADPSLALRTDISAQVMVRGMAGGWFSGKKLSDYLPSSGPADIHQFTNARSIINGHDHDVEIAKDALEFQVALQAGGWR